MRDDHGPLALPKLGMGSLGRDVFPAFRFEALDDLFAVPFHAQITTHERVAGQQYLRKYLHTLPRKWTRVSSRCCPVPYREDAEFR